MADSDVSRIDDNCGEGGGVGRAVERDIREGFDGVIGREAISAHDIGCLGVADAVACDVIGVVGTIDGEAIGEGIATGVGVASGNAGEVGGVDNTVGVGVASGNAGEVDGVGNTAGVDVAGAFSLLKAFFGFFACFSRTCS